MEAFASKIADLAVLFAQEAPAGGGGGQGAAGGESMLISMLPIVAIFVLFYFMLIRPQRREQARRAEMLSNVKKNDHVVTAGGIYGIVTNVHREADEVTVKVDEATNTKLRVTLGSIARILGDEGTDEGAGK